MSSLTQLVLGSPKNHLALGGSKSFMINWPAVSLVFGQGALFATAQVNFPEEGAERSRPPKGQVPIRPGGLAQARERPAGGSTNRAVLSTLPAHGCLLIARSPSGASNDQAFQHDATPQSPKYITNATLRPSGEVTDRLGAPVRHRRGVRAAQQVSAMGPPGCRFA